MLSIMLKIMLGFQRNNTPVARRLAALIRSSDCQQNQILEAHLIHSQAINILAKVCFLLKH